MIPGQTSGFGGVFFVRMSFLRVESKSDGISTLKLAPVVLNLIFLTVNLEPTFVLNKLVWSNHPSGTNDLL